jgi:hypothetical protein
MIRSALLVLIATASLSGQSLWNTDRAIRN